MINRDGQCTSLWQDVVNPYKVAKPGKQITAFDVIIVGGGITGISTALLLQEAGKKCLVVEAANLCFGTTGGTTAHLNTLLDTPYSIIRKNFGVENAAKVAQATTEAIQLIQHNINRFGIDCGYKKADAFLFAQDEKQEEELQEITAASKDAGLDISDTDSIPIPIPFRKAIKVTGQARFNPTMYVYGLAKAFEEAGGVILENCRVMNVDNEDGLSVTTAKGIFKSVDLAYATHMPLGVNLLHLRCIPYRSYAMAVLLENEAYPDDLSYDMIDPYHYYRTQEVNGQSYLIAGGEDHKTGDEKNTQHSFEVLESHIRKYFAVKSVSYKWSSQYFEPADGLPYIGRLPGSPEHIYVACGFGGNGMVYSHVSAMLLKALIADEQSEYVELFDPNRIKPVAGFVNFIQHNSAVIKEFAGRLFSGEELSQLADLAPGEGKIAVYENTKLALYKNDEGRLYGLNPVCRHLGCEVKWNQAEKSWDCPCHGARYDIYGEVITGPASHNLEIINIAELIRQENP